MRGGPLAGHSPHALACTMAGDLCAMLQMQFGLRAGTKAVWSSQLLCEIVHSGLPLLSGAGFGQRWFVVGLLSGTASCPPG